MEYTSLQDVELDRKPQLEIHSARERFFSFLIPTQKTSRFIASRINLTWRALVEAVLVLTVLALLFILSQSRDANLSYGDTSLLQLPSAPKRFSRDPYYLDGAMFNNYSLLQEMLPRFWELSSDSRGFIHVEESDRGPFGPPLNIDIGGLGQRQSYTLSYFHQIHCIAKVTSLYANARLGIGNQLKDDEHMAHCLDVLRQAIMCFADSSLENGLDAWEVVHQCRDHTALQEWERQRQVWNWTAIIGKGHRIDIP